MADGETLNLGSAVEEGSRKLGKAALLKARAAGVHASAVEALHQAAIESIGTIRQLKGVVRMITFAGTAQMYDPNKEDVPLSNVLPADRYIVQGVNDEKPEEILLILEPEINDKDIQYTVVADEITNAADEEIPKQGALHPERPKSEFLGSEE
jgi:hypothetical protein